MVKVKTNMKFVAAITGVFSVWGQDETLDGAVKNLAKEIRDAGYSNVKSVSFVVYTVPKSGYIKWDDCGVFEYDADDNEVGYAVPAYFITEMQPKRPLATMRLNNWRKAYANNGAKLIELLGDRAPTS